MKKIIFFLLVIMLALPLNAYAISVEWANVESYNAMEFENGVRKVYDNGKTAIIDINGEIIIDYSENAKGIASNGIIGVLGDNGYIGFYNTYGVQITDFIYDAHIDVNEKSKVVKVGGIINLSEGDGSTDLIPVSKNNKFGYINSKGEEVIPFIYEYAYGFYGGIAQVCADGILSSYGTYTNGKYGYIKEDGSVILPADSYWAGSRLDTEWGYAIASNGVNDTVLIDSYGNVEKCDEYGYAPVDTKYIEIRDSYGRYGVVDKYNNTVIPLTYCYGIGILEDRFIYNNKLVNNKNELIYEAPEGGLLLKYSYGDFLGVKIPEEDNQWETLIGLIDVNGNMILEPLYKHVSDLGEGLIYARTSDENMLFDYNGNFLCKLNGQPQDKCVNGYFVMLDFDTMTNKVAVNPLVRPKVYINGEKLEFTDAYPYIENSRTLIPLRAIFEKVGADVKWNDEERTVTAKKGDTDVLMTIGSYEMKVNDSYYALDVCPVLIGERTYIPLRAFIESLKAEVTWDAENYTVNIKI